MDFRSIRYFIAVYEELSFSGASKRCFVAQPSISASIQQLENELDIMLFVRHSKGVTPTPKATQFYPGACKLLNDMEKLKQSISEPTESIKLSLALMPFLSGKQVGRIVQKLTQHLPNLDLTLVDITASADARIISLSSANEEEAIHKLWVDHYILAIPLDHPLAAKPYITLDTLDGIAFISRQPCDIIDAWKFAIAKKGISLDTKATVKTEEYALDLVAAGMGVSIVPRHSTVTRSDILTREIRDLPLERTIVLSYEKNHSLPSGVLEAIQEAASQAMEA